MPLKFTWKSVSGVLAMLAGAVTAAAHAGLPMSVSAILIAIGGVIVAVERVADAYDNRVAALTPRPTLPAAPPSWSPGPDKLYVVVAGQTSSVTGPAYVIAPTAAPPAA